MIDPIVQQKNTTFIYGTNYNLQNYNKTRTRNFRINISYNVIKPPKKKANAVKKK